MRPIKSLENEVSELKSYNEELTYEISESESKISDLQTEIDILKSVEINRDEIVNNIRIPYKFIEDSNYESFIIKYHTEYRIDGEYNLNGKYFNDVTVSIRGLENNSEFLFSMLQKFRLERLRFVN